MCEIYRFQGGPRRAKLTLKFGEEGMKGSQRQKKEGFNFSRERRKMSERRC